MMPRRSIYIAAMLWLAAMIMIPHFGIAQTEADRNPLGYAVKKSDVALVKELLKKGADPNKTHDQETPLALSVSLESDEIFNVLVTQKE